MKNEEKLREIFNEKRKVGKVIQKKKEIMEGAMC